MTGLSRSLQILVSSAVGANGIGVFQPPNVWNNTQKLLGTDFASCDTTSDVHYKFKDTLSKEKANLIAFWGAFCGTCIQEAAFINGLDIPHINLIGVHNSNFSPDLCAKKFKARYEKFIWIQDNEGYDNLAPCDNCRRLREKDSLSTKPSQLQTSNLESLTNTGITRRTQQFELPGGELISAWDYFHGLKSMIVTYLKSGDIFRVFPLGFVNAECASTNKQEVEFTYMMTKLEKYTQNSVNELWTKNYTRFEDSNYCSRQTLGNIEYGDYTTTDPFDCMKKCNTMPGCTGVALTSHWYDVSYTCLFKSTDPEIMAETREKDEDSILFVRKIIELRSEGKNAAEGQVSGEFKHGVEVCSDCKEERRLENSPQSAKEVMYV